MSQVQAGLGQAPWPGARWDRRAWLRLGSAALAGGWVARGTPASAVTPSPAPVPASAEPLKLDANENPYGPSPQARAALLAALGESNRYAFDVAPLLEDAIARREGLTREHVVLGSGSHALLCAAGAAYGLAGEVLTADLTYPGLSSYVELHGGRAQRVPLEAGLRYDLEALERRLSPSVGLVFVCNPNNPTGTLLPAARLKPCCERLARRVPVVVDEAYAEYCEPPGFESLVSLVRADAQVVVTRTFSKIHGLAGLRVGYALARPDLANRLRSFRPGGAAMSVSVLGLRAALASYADEAFVLECRRRNSAARATLVAGLRELGAETPDSHTNFVYFRPPGEPEALGRALAARGVHIVAHTQIQGCRITAGTAEQVARALEILRAVWPAATRAA